MRATQSKFITIVFTLVLVAALAANSSAATPTSINYQGQLNTAGGTPVPDGSYSVVFTIYDAASGGAFKWTETQSVATTGGRFSINLGSVSPIIDSVFNATTRYLGIKVGTDPEMTPRVTLVTVPYAFRVSTIDGSTGGSVTGNVNLDASNATTGNVYKGANLFIHDFGTDNTFVGKATGNLTMTGYNNTGSGARTLQNNTTGFQNSAFGMNALLHNSTGDNNTAAGSFSLYNNTMGSNNTATGVNALYLNTFGNSNAAFGYEALRSNTLGNWSVAVGDSSLWANTTGSHNTAVGYLALRKNTTGGDNTAVGLVALRENTGTDNTAIGSAALRDNTLGSANTACGSGALQFNLGSYNTSNGFFTLAANSTGINNSATGSFALENNVLGSYNTADGYQALVTNGGGNYNTAIGDGADVSTTMLVNATAIGANAVVDASNKIRLGDANVTVIEGQVAFTFTSDRNKKENLQPVNGDEVLRKIRGFSMTSWNYKNNDPAKFRHYGPMAQEFFAAFGHDAMGQCGDSISINSGDEAGILMIAVQALEKEKEQMKVENKNLRTELDDLKKMVSQLMSQSKQVSSSQFGMKP